MNKYQLYALGGALLAVTALSASVSAATASSLDDRPAIVASAAVQSDVTPAADVMVIEYRETVDVRILDRVVKRTSSAVVRSKPDDSDVVAIPSENVCAAVGGPRRCRTA